VSFSSQSKRAAGRARPKTSSAALATLARTAVFGLVAIAGAAGALVRHYTHEVPPLRVPVTPRAAPTYDADAGELPVPDFFASDGG
jgi:hypothetical protein